MLSPLFVLYPYVMLKKLYSCLLISSLMRHAYQELDMTPSRQRAKKVVSNSPGLVDFAIGLVIFVLNLPDGQVLFFWGNYVYICGNKTMI